MSANLGAMIAVKQQTFLEFTFTLASCGAPKSGKTDTFDFDREKFRLRPWSTVQQKIKLRVYLSLLTVLSQIK